jgi:hypothetical protein
MLGLKESTYYYKPKSHKKIEEDVKLKFEIEKLHSELPGYGYRRVTEHFKKNGVVINKKRVQRVMQDFGLHSVLKRKSVPFRSYSTDPKCCFKPFDQRAKCYGSRSSLGDRYDLYQN